MNILFIGDIVGDSGTEKALELIPQLRETYDIQFCVANGENCCSNNGITRNKAERLLDGGVDVITLGNHTFRQKEAHSLLHNNRRVIRPINYPKGTSGSGVYTGVVDGVKVAVVNAMGRIYMDYMDCPFVGMDAVLSKLDAEVILVDFHAEATSEKVSMGWYLDGRVSAVIGTHTHVQTADARILPKGTGYITDAGMTGPYNSCLGVDKEITIERFVKCIPVRFAFADGPAQLNGVVLTVEQGKTTRIQPICVTSQR